jgi:hypothetical protein
VGLVRQWVVVGDAFGGGMQLGGMLVSSTGGVTG